MNQISPEQNLKSFTVLEFWTNNGFTMSQKKKGFIFNFIVFAKILAALISEFAVRSCLNYRWKGDPLSLPLQLEGGTHSCCSRNSTQGISSSHPSIGSISAPLGLDLAADKIPAQPYRHSQVRGEMHILVGTRGITRLLCIHWHHSLIKQEGSRFKGIFPWVWAKSSEMFWH